MFTTSLVILLCIACLYYLLSVYAAWRLFRRSPLPLVTPADAYPPISLFKPLKGATPDLYANLASFCRLDYPSFQLLCGVRDPRDPAIAVVQRLQHDFPTCDIALIVNPEVIGSNQKVSTLQHLSRQAKYDIFVISDSDVRVSPDYLHRITPALRDPQVGVVTCLYRSVTPQPFPALLESVLINTSFTTSVLVASQIEETRYAFGATMAITRPCVEAIGGFSVLANYLADDYYLGHFATRAGYRVHLTPYVVETHPDVTSLSELFYHQLRWARTQRLCRPTGYVGTVVTYGTVWAVLGLCPLWTTPLLVTLSCLTLGIRLVSSAFVGKYFLGVTLPFVTCGLVLLMDLISFGIWCLSLRGNTVRWREHTFRVRHDGTMRLIAERDGLQDDLQDDLQDEPPPEESLPDESQQRSY
jgi:ceramide glucosyltransferase